MKTLITLTLAAALAACAATPAQRVTDSAGIVWTWSEEDRLWTDPLGNSTAFDPRTPLCKDVTLKKDVRECVIRR